MVRNYRLAPMSPLIRGLTLVAFLVPAVFVLSVVAGSRALQVPALLVIALYCWIWLRFRPTAFVVHPDALEVIWPLKRRQLPRSAISDVRLIDSRELRRDAGWCMRVGAGGLWGGFGWLWTQRRGIVQMYISRTDGLVWIERPGDRPWLITPEHPDVFVRALSPRPSAAPAPSQGASRDEGVRGRTGSPSP